MPKPKPAASTPTSPTPGNPPSTELSTALQVREGSAAKLGKRGGSQLTYQVLLDQARQQVYLRITSNPGGGYFSKEAVPLSAVRRCLADHPTGQPLGGPAFKTAYRNRSNNNAGFFAAALVAEGLLKRDADEPSQLIDTQRMDTWEAEALATAGDLPAVVLKSADDAAGAQANAPPVAKPGKARRKPSSITEGDDDPPPVP